MRDRGGTKAIPTEAQMLFLILTWRQIFVDLTIGRWLLVLQRAFGGLGGVSLGTIHWDGVL